MTPLIDPYGPMINKTWTAQAVRKLDYSRCAYKDCHGRVSNRGGNLCDGCIADVKAEITDAKDYERQES